MLEDSGYVCCCIIFHDICYSIHLFVLFFTYIWTVFRLTWSKCCSLWTIYSLSFFKAVLKQNSLLSNTFKKPFSFENAWNSQIHCWKKNKKTWKNWKCTGGSNVAVYSPFFQKIYVLVFPSLQDGNFQPFKTHFFIFFI